MKPKGPHVIGLISRTVTPAGAEKSQGELQGRHAGGHDGEVPHSQLLGKGSWGPCAAWDWSMVGA